MIACRYSSNDSMLEKTNLSFVDIFSNEAIHCFWFPDFSVAHSFSKKEWYWNAISLASELFGLMLIIAGTREGIVHKT
jgi:hypothetical protein